MTVECSIEGCSKDAHRTGLCNGHYLKKRRYGDPLGGSWTWGEPRPRKYGDAPCSVEGCERVAEVLAMCKLHWQRQHNTGEVGPPGLKPRGKDVAACAVEGCERPEPYIKGMCSLHYHRRLKTGDVGPASIKIARPGEGHLTTRGYRWVAGRPEHRVLMEANLGRPLLRSESVHHINGDRADNRIENLELWSSSQPSGQRAVDKLRWAREILALYGEFEQLRLI